MYRNPEGEDSPKWAIIVYAAPNNTFLLVDLVLKCNHGFQGPQEHNFTINAIAFSSSKKIIK